MRGLTQLLAPSVACLVDAWHAHALRFRLHAKLLYCAPNAARRSSRQPWLSNHTTSELYAHPGEQQKELQAGPRTTWATCRAS